MECRLKLGPQQNIFLPGWWKTKTSKKGSRRLFFSLGVAFSYEWLGVEVPRRILLLFQDHLVAPVKAECLVKNLVLVRRSEVVEAQIRLRFLKKSNL